jgi:hypothetical protein
VVQIPPPQPKLPKTLGVKLQRQIPEIVVPGKPLGRHVNHDPRSLQYTVGAPAKALQTVLHPRLVPVFDQGNLGSCTGNASVGALGTAPLYDSVKGQNQTLDENFAIAVYSAATALDDYAGTYPPTDTGSDGLSVAKVLKTKGLISGYLHATSLVAMQAALQDTPVIVGVNWYEGFDNPSATGLVQVSGQVRGGHEFEVIGIDVENQLFEAVNSWGESWGVNGHFKFSFDDMTRLLSEQGDCTQLLPLTVPAPVPTPVPPTPTPTPAVDPDILNWWSATREWTNSRHFGANGKAVKAAKTLAKAKGLI